MICFQFVAVVVETMYPRPVSSGLSLLSGRIISAYNHLAMLMSFLKYCSDYEYLFSFMLGHSTLV